MKGSKWAGITRTPRWEEVLNEWGRCECGKRWRKEIKEDKQRKEKKGKRSEGREDEVGKQKESRERERG